VSSAKRSRLDVGPATATVANHDSYRVFRSDLQHETTNERCNPMPDDSDDIGFSQEESDASLAAPQGDPTTLPGNFSLQPPEPLVQPMVRLLAQWVAPWGTSFMRPPGQRNIAASATSADNWAANGCYPTSVAMVARWWAEDNPETSGLLGFPFPQSQDTMDPPELCGRLFGNPFVPASANPVPPEKQQASPFSSYDDPSTDFVVNGGALQNAVRSIQRTDIPGPVTVPLAFLRAQCTGNLSLRQLTLKFWLQFGPVIALMQRPGHFVVIDGYRDDTIYICDPGNILVNPKIWSTQPQLRSGSALPPGESGNAGYVSVDDTQNFQTANGAFNAPWLMQIGSFDVAFIDPLNTHPAWSDLSIGR
jgi:hypothetical protein